MGYVSYLEDIFEGFESQWRVLESRLLSAGLPNIDDILREGHSIIENIDKKISECKKAFESENRRKKEIENLADIATSPEYDIAEKYAETKAELEEIQVKNLDLSRTLERLKNECQRLTEERRLYLRKFKSVSKENEKLKETLESTQEQFEFQKQRADVLEQSGWQFFLDKEGEKFEEHCKAMGIQKAIKPEDEVDFEKYCESEGITRVFKRPSKQK